MDQQDDFPDDLVTVFHGPMSDAIFVESRLRAEGLFTHILNQNIKTVDPLITGTNMFDVEVQVAATELERAREVLRVMRDRASADEGRREHSLERLRLAGWIILGCLILAVLLAALATFF